MRTFNRQGLLLAALMLAALVAALCGPITRFVEGWQPAYLVGASLLIALEAGVIHMAFRRGAMWFDELVRYLVPELFVMAVLMRVATALARGNLLDQARAWLYDPLSVFDIGFMFALMLGFLVGVFAHAIVSDLLVLEPSDAEANLRVRDDMQHAVTVATQDRHAALRRIGARFVQGGALLLVALAIESVNIEQISAPGLPPSALSSIAALIYFTCGFLLYSQARLALLRSRWQLDGAHVAAEVPRRWSRVSWLIIGGVLGVCALLPRAYGLGLLGTLQRSIGLLGYGIALVGYALTTLISLLAVLPLLLISWLSGRSATSTAPLDLPQFPPPPDAPPPAVYEPSLGASLIFWTCMALLAIYAVSIVVQRNPALVRALTQRGPIMWLLKRLGWLWRDTRAWAGQAAERARSLLARPVATRQRRIPSLRLGRLAPRELVRYFYRSTLQRAAAGGLPRRRSQTPYEYSARLAEQLPDAQPDLAELTEAFVLAEYSPRPLDAEAARRARRPWERVRRKLRKLAHPEDSPPAS